MSDPLDNLRRQTPALAADLRALVVAFEPVAARYVRHSEVAHVRRVISVGSGDSHFAGLAASPAFRRLSGLPLTATPSLSYAYEGDDIGPDTLIIGVSASGATTGPLLALEHARQRGAGALAVTATNGSPLAAEATAALVANLADNPPSPGVRTYQASLVAHLSLAIALGESRGAMSPADARRATSDLLDIADLIDRVQPGIAAFVEAAADRLSPSPVSLVLGAGPNVGTAKYMAAKLVEAAAIFAIGQDVEEWWHVERFAYPLNAPIVLLAPDGRGQSRAAEVAAGAKGVGHPVLVIAPQRATALRRHADLYLEAPEVAEHLSPLVYGLIGAPLAAAVAARLGRAPFRADRPEVGQAMKAYVARTDD